MVTRSIAFVVIAISCLAAAGADLQFTPKESAYELEGIKFKQLVFSDGTNKAITYAAPPGWEYSGSTTKLTLHPAKKPRAQGIFSKVNLNQPVVFDEVTTRKLTEEALTLVPHGSTNVAVVAREKNPLFINRKETFLVTISYTFHGEKYECSMMFLNRGNEQIRFQFVSLASDFKDLQRAFLGSHCSWENL